MSMITATTWVPRGYAAEFPTKYAKLAKLQLEDAKEDLESAENGKDDGEDEEMASEVEETPGGVRIPKSAG